METMMLGIKIIVTKKQPGAGYRFYNIRRTPERERVAIAWAASRSLVQLTATYWEEQAHNCCSKVRGIGGRRSLRRDWVPA